ncbi:MAG: peptide ABC transporter substrate-binding protein [Synergistaceae bacterium]|nr:peptide ABC transporter substrate-binding protein [Synergistaceae bacterium]
MKRKIFLSLLFIFLTPLILFAATKPDEIVYDLGIDPKTIDPALNHALDGAIVIVNSFDGLLRISSRYTPEPACATHWDISEDGLKWTFHLRENLKWSDGKKLTAEDFKTGFLRVINPETGSPYAHYAFFIKNGEAFYRGRAKAEDVGVSAPDEKTFVLELEYKNPLILEYLTFATFAPAREDVVKNPSWAARPESHISNGAFKLESWRHGDGGEITLVKNPEYWDSDNVKIQRLRFVFINDSNTALAAFRSKRIDYLTSVPSLILPRLIQRGEATTHPVAGTAFCVFNLKHKPFDDVRVRKAFSLAIDRKIIVERILRGGQRPAGGLVCDLVPGTTDEKDFRTEGGSFLPENADIEQARKLLAEAGYPEGKGFPKVTYLYSSSPGNKIIAEILQGMWKKYLGVQVELSNQEWKVFITSCFEGDFDIAIRNWIMDFFDGASILEEYISDGPQNITHYSNPNFDSAMRKVMGETDRVKRINYMHEAEKILIEDMPIIPLYFSSSPLMQNKNVKNIIHSPLGLIFFRNAEKITE